MESRVEQAAMRHRKGYNCAQAVACTYCDLVGIDEETMFKVTEGFGLGMGNMAGTCGAISGAIALAGMINSCGDLEQPVTKASTYKLERPIMEEFAAMNKSVICRDIKGVDTGVVLRSCPDCVRDAAALAEKHLFADK